ncbi:hypothetical protein KBY66_06800 [Synechococcus sp. Tobar12-5m-g]|uniref:hypothetical protein n=1 Tax=unclassified Synechococcus TaxID=2626047 RepID=UPI0020CCE813|nr:MULTISPECIES: hypothetical protein [unclassified Synechococcus]MCP9772332.1 hypothetical protein [Synechococcus sp. Tobar12-5m-g]MCP9873274.1 hypothetical protein [Synechococcus sp. Cruz CV-v-12]
MDLKQRLRQRLQAALRAGRLGPLDRLQRLDRDQWQALAAFRGLVHQAFAARPFAPQVCSDLWDQGSFRSSSGLKPFFSPARRERENASHHYGHDIQLKRHAGLPLIGAPLPFLLEHGLKVSEGATFETPRPWAQGYLCMGPLRAGWITGRFGLPATPIGPWIAYARPVLDPEALAELRAQLGPALLVVLAHSWDQVERSNDLMACIDEVEQRVRTSGYRSVIWLRHWKDPHLEGLPPGWILACNGHRSNPWFLDGMRTLLELSDGLASNAFGTHLGYGVALGKRLHWIDGEAEQDLSGLEAAKAQEESREWAERRRLSVALRGLLAHGAGSESGGPVWSLLDPFWGFGRFRGQEELGQILHP